MDNPELRPDPGVRVLSPDEEDARAVARAIASSTAGAILRCFQGEERNASEIASTLNQPIPTIMYHLDALLEAGLIEVSRITYSVKGREVKKYRQSGQVFIVAPYKADIRETLLKYASLFGCTVLSAGFAYFLLQWMSGFHIPQNQVMSDMNAEGLMTGVVESKAAIAYGGEHIAREVVQYNTSVPSAAPVYSPPADSLQAYVPDLGTGAVPNQDLFPLNLFGIPDIFTGIIIGGCAMIILLICIESIGMIRKKGQ